ncbi:MAG: HAD family hydrolase [Actinobacteria bacterium]|nr:HAD family hydrolase [Actinomycetota bacterium]
MTGARPASDGRPAHIVWDWNGTLLDDNEAVLSAVNAVCASFGRPALTMAEWRAAFFRPLDRCYERLLGQPLTAADWGRIDRHYHHTYAGLLPEVRLAAGVPEALHTWSAGGGTQSLLSMWFHDDLVDLVDRLGLTGHFALVDGLRQDVGGGSKAEYLDRHLAALRLPPADVVLIGDVVDDAVAARSVGAGCVLVSTGVAARAVLVETGWPVADSVAAALAVVTGGRPDPGPGGVRGHGPAAPGRQRGSRARCP